MSYIVTPSKETYTLYLNSTDKINGSTNNSAQFNINWETFLPHTEKEKQKYKIIFNFQSSGGYFKDNAAIIVYTSAKIFLDFGCSSNSYSTSSNAQTNMLGLINRDVQVAAGTSSNVFSAFFYQNCSKTISRPTQNLITVNIFNTFTNALITNTDNSATSVPTADFVACNMIIEFIPMN
jgi:hypothetical protein